MSNDPIKERLKKFYQNKGLPYDEKKLEDASQKFAGDPERLTRALRSKYTSVFTNDDYHMIMGTDRSGIAGPVPGKIPAPEEAQQKVAQTDKERAQKQIEETEIAKRSRRDEIKDLAKMRQGVSMENRVAQTMTKPITGQDGDVAGVENPMEMQRDETVSKDPLSTVGREQVRNLGTGGMVGTYLRGEDVEYMKSITDPSQFERAFHSTIPTEPKIEIDVTDNMDTAWDRGATLSMKTYLESRSKASNLGKYGAYQAKRQFFEEQLIANYGKVQAETLESLGFYSEKEFAEFDKEAGKLLRQINKAVEDKDELGYEALINNNAELVNRIRAISEDPNYQRLNQIGEYTFRTLEDLDNNMPKDIIAAKELIESRAKEVDLQERIGARGFWLRTGQMVGRSALRMGKGIAETLYTVNNLTREQGMEYTDGREITPAGTAAIGYLGGLVDGWINYIEKPSNKSAGLFTRSVELDKYNVVLNKNNEVTGVYDKKTGMLARDADMNEVQAQIAGITEDDIQRNKIGDMDAFLGQGSDVLMDLGTLIFSGRAASKGATRLMTMGHGSAVRNVGKLADAVNKTAQANQAAGRKFLSTRGQINDLAGTIGMGSAMIGQTMSSYFHESMMHHGNAEDAMREALMISGGVAMLNMVFPMEKEMAGLLNKGLNNANVRAAIVKAGMGTGKDRAAMVLNTIAQPFIKGTQEATENVMEKLYTNVMHEMANGTKGAQMMQEYEVGGDMEEYSSLVALGLIAGFVSGGAMSMVSGKSAVDQGLDKFMKERSITTEMFDFVMDNPDGWNQVLDALVTNKRMDAETRDSWISAMESAQNRVNSIAQGDAIAANDVQGAIYIAEFRRKNAERYQKGTAERAMQESLVRFAEDAISKRLNQYNVNESTTESQVQEDGQEAEAETQTEASQETVAEEGLPLVVARDLADHMGEHLIEGDGTHPPLSIKKMEDGRFKITFYTEPGTELSDVLPEGALEKLGFYGGVLYDINVFTAYTDQGNVEALMEIARLYGKKEADAAGISTYLSEMAAKLSERLVPTLPTDTEQTEATVEQAEPVSEQIDPVVEETEPVSEQTEPVIDETPAITEDVVDQGTEAAPEGTLETEESSEPQGSPETVQEGLEESTQQLTEELSKKEGETEYFPYDTTLKGTDARANILETDRKNKILNLPSVKQHIEDMRGELSESEFARYLDQVVNNAQNVIDGVFYRADAEATMLEGMGEGKSERAMANQAKADSAKLQAINQEAIDLMSLQGDPNLAMYGEAMVNKLKEAQPDNLTDLILSMLLNGLKFLPETYKTETGFGVGRGRTGKIHGKEEERAARWFMDEKNGKSLDGWIEMVMEQVQGSEFITGEITEDTVRDAIRDVMASLQTKKALIETLYNSMAVNGQIITDAAQRVAMKQEMEMFERFDPDAYSEMQEKEIPLDEVEAMLQESSELADNMTLEEIQQMEAALDEMRAERTQLKKETKKETDEGKKPDQADPGKPATEPRADDEGKSKDDDFSKESEGLETEETGEAGIVNQELSNAIRELNDPELNYLADLFEGNGNQADINNAKEWADGIIQTVHALFQSGMSDQLGMIMDERLADIAKSVVSALDGSQKMYEGDQITALEQSSDKRVARIAKTANSIGGLLSGLGIKVQVFTDSMAYAEAHPENQRIAASNSAGSYTKADGVIRINAAASETNSATVYHEMAEALLFNLHENNRESYDALVETISQGIAASSKLSTIFNQFLGMYTGTPALKQKEAAAEMLAQVASGELVLNKSQMDQLFDMVIDFLENTSQLLGLGTEWISDYKKSDREFMIDMTNTLAGAMRGETGNLLETFAEAPLKGANKKKAQAIANKTSGSAATKAARVATELKVPVETARKSINDTGKGKGPLVLSKETAPEITSGEVRKGAQSTEIVTTPTATAVVADTGRRGPGLQVQNVPSDKGVFYSKGDGPSISMILPKPLVDAYNTLVGKKTDQETYQAEQIARSFGFSADGLVGTIDLMAAEFLEGKSKDIVVEVRTINRPDSDNPFAEPVAYQMSAAEKSRINKMIDTALGQGKANLSTILSTVAAATRNSLEAVREVYSDNFADVMRDDKKGEGVNKLMKRFADWEGMPEEVTGKIDSSRDITSTEKVLEEADTFYENWMRTYGDMEMGLSDLFTFLIETMGRRNRDGQRIGLSPLMSTKLLLRAARESGDYGYHDLSETIMNYTGMLMSDAGLSIYGLRSDLNEDILLAKAEKQFRDEYEKQSSKTTDDGKRVKEELEELRKEAEMTKEENEELKVQLKTSIREKAGLKGLITKLTNAFKSGNQAKGEEKAIANKQDTNTNGKNKPGQPAETPRPIGTEGKPETKSKRYTPTVVRGDKSEPVKTYEQEQASLASILFGGNISFSKYGKNYGRDAYEGVARSIVAMLGLENGRPQNLMGQQAINKMAQDLIKMAQDRGINMNANQIMDLIDNALDVQVSFMEGDAPTSLRSKLNTFNHGMPLNVGFLAKTLGIDSGPSIQPNVPNMGQGTQGTIPGVPTATPPATTPTPPNVAFPNNPNVGQGTQTTTPGTPTTPPPATTPTPPNVSFPNNPGVGKGQQTNTGLGNPPPLPPLPKNAPPMAQGTQGNLGQMATGFNIFTLDAIIDQALNFIHSQNNRANISLAQAMMMDARMPQNKTGKDIAEQIEAEYKRLAKAKKGESIKAMIDRRAKAAGKMYNKLKKNPKQMDRFIDFVISGHINDAKLVDIAMDAIFGYSKITPEVRDRLKDMAKEVNIISDLATNPKELKQQRIRDMQIVLAEARMFGNAQGFMQTAINLMIANALTGINTIYTGNITSLISATPALLGTIVANPIASTMAIKESMKRFSGISRGSFFDTLRTNFNTLQELGTYADTAGKGEMTFGDFILTEGFSGLARIIKRERDAGRTVKQVATIAGTLLVAPTIAFKKFAFALNSFDAAFSHKFGEVFALVEAYHELGESKKLPGIVNPIQAYSQRKKLMQDALNLMKYDTDKAELEDQARSELEDLRNLGVDPAFVDRMQNQKGYVQRRVKELMSEGRAAELRYKGFEMAKASIFMGQPTGFFGVAYDKINDFMTIKPGSENNAGNLIAFGSKALFGMFLRIGFTVAQSMHRGSALGFLGNTINAFQNEPAKIVDPKTYRRLPDDMKATYTMMGTEFDAQKISKQELQQRLFTGILSSTASVLAAMAMFDFDEEGKFELREDRKIDITANLTGNHFANREISEMQNVLPYSTRFKFGDGRANDGDSWSTPLPYTFSPYVGLNFVALGAIRDFITYEKEKKGRTRSGQMGGYIAGSIFGYFANMSFAKNLGLIDQIISQNSSAWKSEEQVISGTLGKVVEGLTAPVKTALIPNMAKDIYWESLIAYDQFYNENMSAVRSRKMMSALVRDVPLVEYFYSPEYEVDIFGNPILRRSKAKELAQRYAYTLATPYLNWHLSQFLKDNKNRFNNPEFKHLKQWDANYPKPFNPDYSFLDLTPEESMTLKREFGKLYKEQILSPLAQRRLDAAESRSEVEAEYDRFYKIAKQQLYALQFKKSKSMGDKLLWQKRMDKMNEKY